MRRFLYDTNVFVYALGAEHPYQAPCAAVIARAQRGELRGEASVDLVQEFLHHRLRQTGDRSDAARYAREVAALCRLHELRPDDVPLALSLFERHSELSARDAFFAAVALNRRIDAILTADRDFESLPGLERVDPMDRAVVDTLAG
ncbi:MAG: type II toxin-antitoxin system VapC family toxin [Solirubrobacteraceae bacterium]